MTYETILVSDVVDGVISVTLNRPEVLNSYNDQMCEEIQSFWIDMKNDQRVRAIVLTASGDRAFCTGVDVKERLASESAFGDRERPWAELSDPGSALGPKRNELWKPVIAAVKGMCAGGAAYLIAECDVVICSPDATFFDPHVTYGLVAALEPIMLSYRMHPSDALRMAIMGLHERISAERALTCGLVTEICEAGGIVERAVELAGLIASQPPVAVQGTIKAFWRSLDLGRDQALASALMYTQIGNPIATEGLDRAASKPRSPAIR